MKRILALLSALMLIASFCRAEERSDTAACSRPDRPLVRSVVGAGVGLVVNASVTEILKHSVHEIRPDRSDNGSFPSRHASYAFTLASIAARELGAYSPFWAIGAHTAANAVAMQRVYASRHFPGDVLAGAALGVGSTALGYAVAELIFPVRGRRSSFTVSGGDRELTASTVALIPFCSHDRAYAVGCGIESAVSIGFPLSDTFALGASLRMRSQTLYSLGEYVGNINGGAVTADVRWLRSAGRWIFDAGVSVGALHNFDRPCGVVPSWAVLVAAEAGAHCRIARALTVGGRLGCDVTDRPSSWGALSVALVTRAEF